MGDACPKCGYRAEAVVTARWVLHLDKRLTSANLRTVNAGTSRWRYAKERDQWGWFLKAVARSVQVVPATAHTKRRVTISRLYCGRQREMDADNLMGGCKALIDALVRERVVHDDKAAWLELHVTQWRTVGEDMTVVTVEELG